MAHPGGARVLVSGFEPRTPKPDRYAAISRVLLGVFFLNLAVAVAKIAFGYLTGAISILSDGFHSLTDSASNVVALVGVRVAQRPPDANHPYGHRKYETMAAAAIAVFLAIVGGLFLFGAPGLVLGPVILAATIALLDILKRRTANARPAAERT